MSVVVIGAGNWGATLARLISRRRRVVLWTRDQQELERIRKQRLDELRAGRKDRWSEKLTIECKFASPLSVDDVLLIVIPSSQVRSVCEELRRHCRPPYPIIVSASKGIEHRSFMTMSQVIADVLPEATVAVLTGPNLANEVDAGMRTKAVLACSSVQRLLYLKDLLANDVLGFELSRDAVEVELCAALKGAIAIGVGLADGLQLGRNFLGLLLTYALHEFVEVGKFLGISTQYVFGIAGLGDLIATCWSSDSRNYRFGRLLAEGVGTKDALRRVGMVVEGVRVARTVADLASLNVSVNIFSAIARAIEQPGSRTFETFRRVVLEYRVLG